MQISSFGIKLYTFIWLTFCYKCHMSCNQQRQMSGFSPPCLLSSMFTQFHVYWLMKPVSMPCKKKKTLCSYSRDKSNKTPEISRAILRYWAPGYQMTSGVVKYRYKESEPGKCSVIKARVEGLQLIE